MKNTTFLLFLLTLGFVGATSCGDQKDSGQALENQALRATLAQQKANTTTVTQNQTVTHTQTQTQTQTRTVTASGTSTSTGTSRQ